MVADAVTKIDNGSGDSIITPRRILAGQTDDEVFQVGFGGRPAVSLPKPRAIELLGDQSAVPFEDRLGFGDGDRVRHQFAEGDGSLGECVALVVGE